MKEVQFKVTDDEQGLSLIECLLSRLSKENYSRKKLKALIDNGCCRVSGKVAKISTFKVVSKEIINVRLPESDIEKKHMPHTTRVLYEDDSILAIDKPYGVVSDGKKLKELEKGRGKIFLLHRLDKDTSGVLLFAKNEAVYQEMLKLFKERQIRKQYLAIVDGYVKSEKRSIKNTMSCVQKRHGQSVWAVTNDGLAAHTECKRIQGTKTASLVHLFPYTGRTHQLRVHMSFIGHPILGDSQYGHTFMCPYKPIRQMLHAEKVQFCHPVTKKELSISSPVPEDMNAAISAIFGEETY